MAGELEAVTEVRPLGEREVAFSTRSPFNTLPARLTYLFVTGPVPAGGAAPPGTGPYRVRYWERNGRTILEAFPDHRNGAAPIRHVEFLAVPDARERARLLQRHEVDLISDVFPDAMAGLAAESGLRTLSRPGLRTVFLAMDCASQRSPYVTPAGNPFRLLKLREAVARAIDRDALVGGPLRGYAEAAHQLPSPSEVGFDESLLRRRLDVSAARRLVAEAAPGGFDVELDYVPGKYLAIDDVVQTLSTQLARIGIRAHPHGHAMADYLRRVEAHDTSLYVMGWRNESGSAHESYASLLHSPGNGAGVTNGGGYSNVALDALLDGLSAEPNDAKRVELLRRATRTVDADLPLITLYRQKDLYAFASNLDFEPQLYPRVRLINIRWKK